MTGKEPVLTKRSARKVLAFLIINILCLGFFSLSLKSDHNLSFGLFAIFQGVMGVLLLKDVYPAYSVAPMFLVVSEVMHFGEALLLGIGRRDLFNVLNEDLAGNIINYNIANIFAFAVQAMVVVGMLIAAGSKAHCKVHQINKIDRIYNKHQNLSYQVGLIAFVIGTVPTFLYYGGMLRLTLSGVTYAGIRSQVDLGPLMLLTIFFHPGIILMILGSLKKKRRAKIIFWAACVFEVICMLTGNRGQQLMYLLTYLFIYYRFIGKFNWKKILPLVVVGYVAIAFMYAVSSTRLYGFSNFGLQEFLQVLMGEPLLALLAEQGATLNMVALTVRDVPSYTPFALGSQYLVSLLSVFPNTGGWQGDLPDLVNTLHYLNTTLPLGDSYIAELYHNFGWVSLPFAVLIGLFIGRVDQKIEYFVKTANYLWLGSYLILFRKLLWMVRCNFFNFLYDFVWSTVVIFLLVNLVASFKKRKG